MRFMPATVRTKPSSPKERHTAFATWTTERTRWRAFCIEQGIKSGDRVALMFDKGVHTYVALLAVLKVNAAYVPLDASFPNERIGFILKDAGVKRDRHHVGVPREAHGLCGNADLSGRGRRA